MSIEELKQRPYFRPVSSNDYSVNRILMKYHRLVIMPLWINNISGLESFPVAPTLKQFEAELGVFSCDFIPAGKTLFEVFTNDTNPCFAERDVVEVNSSIEMLSKLEENSQRSAIPAAFSAGARSAGRGRGRPGRRIKSETVEETIENSDELDEDICPISKRARHIFEFLAYPNTEEEENLLKLKATKWFDITRTPIAFMNSSDDRNLQNSSIDFKSSSKGFKIEVKAVRQINPGDELLFPYL